MFPKVLEILLEWQFAESGHTAHELTLVLGISPLHIVAILTTCDERTAPVQNTSQFFFAAVMNV